LKLYSPNANIYTDHLMNQYWFNINYTLLGGAD